MPAPMSSSSPKSRHLLPKEEQLKQIHVEKDQTPVASVIEIDIEAGKDIGKKLLVGVEGFCQTDTGRSDRIGRQRCQEGGRVRVILSGYVCFEHIL